MATEANQLDEYSESWALESSFPMFRGISSLIVSLVCIILFISLIFKIIMKWRHNPSERPDVCKYCMICCGRRSGESLCVPPAPLDVAICIYLFGFLCFLCNGYGIICYGSWVEASQHFLGTIAIYIFAVLVGFVTLCVYLYLYSMLILAISQAGTEFEIPKNTQRIHKFLMITAALSLPTGIVS